MTAGERDVLVYTVEVGYTSRRPVRPDEHLAYVLVASEDETGVDAMLTAAQMVACWPWCVMPTRTTILDVEI